MNLQCNISDRILLRQRHVIQNFLKVRFVLVLYFSPFNFDSYWNYVYILTLTDWYSWNNFLYLDANWFGVWCTCPHRHVITRERVCIFSSQQQQQQQPKWMMIVLWNEQSYNCANQHNKMTICHRERLGTNNSILDDDDFFSEVKLKSMCSFFSIHAPICKHECVSNTEHDLDKITAMVVM